MHSQSITQKEYITDSSLHSEILKDWALTYDQVSAGRFESFLREISFDGVQIYEEKFKPSIFQRGEARKDSLCIGLFSEISDHAIWMGKNIGGKEILSCYDQDEIFLRTPENSAFCSLTIPLDLLDLNEKQLSCIRDCHILCEEKSKLFHYRFINLVNNIMQNNDALNHEIVKKQVKSEMIELSDSFLNMLCDHREPTKVSTQRANQVVKKVCDILHENHDQFYSIEELSQLTCTSRRTLQNCFELITGKSPALFLKIVKLNAVRRALYNANENSSIGDIASEWGFWHLSQFAMDYKRLFGESPSQTLSQSKTLRRS